MDAAARGARPAEAARVEGARLTVQILAGGYDKHYQCAPITYSPGSTRRVECAC